MTIFESWKQVVEQAAIGDEEATQLMAERLEAVGEKTTAQDQQQAALAQEYTKLRNITENARVLHRLEREYSSLNAEVDPDAYARVLKRQAELAASRPDLSFEATTRISCEAVEEELGDPANRDYASAIASMAKARGKGSAFEDSEGNFEDRVRSHYDEDAARAHEGVQEILNERRRLQEEQHERFSQRPEERPKLKRMFPYPR